MYQPLDYLNDNTNEPFAIKGVLNGLMKSIFDGESYYVTEEEYVMKKNILEFYKRK